MLRSKKNQASPPKTCFKAMETKTAVKILKDQAECRKSLTFFVNTLEHDRRLLRNSLDKDRLMFCRQQARRISTKSLCLPGNILKEYASKKSERGNSKHFSNQRLFPVLRQAKAHMECEESISTSGVTLRLKRDNEEYLVKQRRFTNIGCSVDQNTFNLQNFVKRSSSCLPPRTQTSSVSKATPLPFINLQHTRLQNSEPMIMRRSSLITANDDVDDRPAETEPTDDPIKNHGLYVVNTKCDVHRNTNRETKSLLHRTLSEETKPSLRTILNSKAPSGSRFNAPPSLRRKPVTAQRKAHHLP